MSPKGYKDALTSEGRVFVRGEYEKWGSRVRSWLGIRWNKGEN